MRGRGFDSRRLHSRESGQSQRNGGVKRKRSLRLFHPARPRPHFQCVTTVLLSILLVVLSTPASASPASASVALPLPAQLRPVAAVDSPQALPELVILVHGMGRTSVSMRPLAKALERHGYEVLNWGYSSLCCSISELSQRLQRDLRQHRGPPPRRIHFVGHSLGNIIIRRLLSLEDAPGPVGRVVMLAPPNQGAHAADRYARLLGWLLRPLPELRPDSASTVRTLPPLAGVSIGVIAGKYDGKVSLAETHLAEESAHVVVPALHSFLMSRDDVQQLVIGFLRQGSFPELDGVQPASCQKVRSIASRDPSAAEPGQPRCERSGEALY